MENLCYYFLKVNGLLVVFYFAYFIFLRKETFFQSNRWFLLMGIVSSFIFPFISFTNVIWVDPEPFVSNTTYYSPISTFQPEPIKEVFNWNQLLLVTYILVCLFFLTKLTIEVFSFFSIIRKGKKIRTNNMVLVETTESQNPFSFFNYLVFNQSHFTEEELNIILIHEKIHIQQKHTFDVLVSKILCLLFWANPIAWLYRKAILENLEFIADAKTASVTNNPYIYQKTLLKAVINQRQLSITNQFYQSLIKKRIVMLNTHESSKSKLWKYSLIVPFLVAFIFLFQIETVAQVKENENVTTSNNITSSSTKIESKIDKNSTDKNLKELADALKATLDIQLKFEKIKRNKKKEITRIKVIGNIDKTYQSVIELDEDQGIEPFTVVAFKDHNNEKNITFVKDKEKLQTKTAPSESTIKGKAAVIEYEGWKIIKEEADKNPVLFVVNETKQATGTNIQFDYTIEVLHSRELSEKEAVKKYGNVGKNGAYEFTVEKRDYANQLYIINGKEYTTNDLKGKKINLDGTIIKLSNDEGKAKYGKKGKNGVSILNGKAIITDDGKKDVIYIKSTNSIIESNSSPELPQPPTPPTSAFERVGKVPTPPKFPEAPSVPSNLQDEKEMKKFEEKMAVFEMKIKKMEPQIAQFEKEMEEYEKEMQGFEPDMKVFEKQMEEFEKKMEAYQEQIIQNKNIVIDKRTERREEINQEQDREIKIARLRAEENQKAREEAHKAAIKSKIEAEEAKVQAERAKRKAEIEKRIAEEQKRKEATKKD